jgi:hypothetical protein
VGESTTLDVVVRGSGNVQMIAEPRMGPLASFKIYDDQPTSKINRGGNSLSGSRAFHKALVPMQAGDLTLPAAEITYFDPDDGSFRTARSEPIALTVLPSDNREDLRLTESLAPTTGKVSVRILADDILPTHKGTEVLAGSAFSPVRRPWILGLWLLLPPVGYVAFWVVDRRRRHYLVNSHLRRRRGALRRARQQLRVARGGGGEGTPEGAASRCLRGYIGDKLGLEGSALTPGEVRRHLAGRGVGEALLGRTCGLLERLESARYAQATASEGVDPIDEVEVLLRELERGLKR